MTTDKYIQSAIDAELDNISSSTGGRNNALNSAAFALGSLCAANWNDYTRQQAEDNLMQAALDVELQESEARATIKSGLDDGEQEPRKKPEALNQHHNKKQFFKTPADAVGAWSTLPAADSDHAYLQRKNIQPYIARQNGDELIIPLQTDFAGTVTSVQRILPTRNKSGTDKLFIKGTQKKGAFCLIGEVEEDKPLLFCEGYATGASIHEATGLPVVVCFDSGNLPRVAQKLRNETNQCPFIYCVDADEAGKNAARKAVKKSGGLDCIPDFSGINSKGNDFNDLHNVAGLNTVKKQISEMVDRVESGLLNAGFTGQSDDDKPQFKLENGKLYRLHSKKDELGVKSDYICIGSAIQVKAATVDMRGGNHGRLLVFYDRQYERQFVMPMEMLASETSKLAGALLNRGYWCVAPHQKFIRDGIAEYVNSVRPPETLTTTESTGWHDHTFVFTGGEVIGNDNKVIFTGADTDIYAAQGTLTQWQQAVAELCTGNSRLLFSTSLAFAGVLMPLTGDEGAGTNIYGDTSTGKTTTQRAAASVWGSPEPGGFISKWNATATGLEIQAVQRNHTLFCIDELGEVDPKIAGRLIYQLASGVQKGRGRAGDTGIGLANLKTWKMPFISSAEKTLAQHIEEAGQRLYGGQAVRCVDIPADAGAGLGVFEDVHGTPGNTKAAGAAFSERIKDATHKFYGTAGRAFVQALLKMGIAKTLDFVTSKRTEFMLCLPSDAGSVPRRAAKLFSLSAAAGELAIQLNILPWQPGTAMEAAKRCFNDWLAENGTGNPEEQAALAQVAYFIETNQENFRRWNEKDASSGGRNISHQVGYLSEDENEYYIMPEIFKKDTCKGYRPEFVLKQLDKRGILVYSPKRRQLQIRLPNAKKPSKVYAIKTDFTENVLDTLDTLDTTIHKANNNGASSCNHPVATSYPTGDSVTTESQSCSGQNHPEKKSVSTVTTAGNSVSTENSNENNVVPTVSSVTTIKTGLPKKTYQKPYVGSPSTALVMDEDFYSDNGGGAIS
ncbi:DUF927 domain-containing protein [Candidatus Venteria ishoeyi]|uniref:DUF927 domain-containing protein n=1 Tax=Candidatus Venteria ishoeyi TaxID=1899563 RepID=UPI0025A59AC2|nr:DUF927 domain-containing protein [Candidatus Venteria ishoeyi]MDM8545169.1 DUF927 domain-containing protein [Candidatus Venteria ishoeyi]